MNIPTVANPPVSDNTNTITLSIDQNLRVGPEGYELLTEPYSQSVHIKARDPSGIYYGIQTLLGYVDDKEGATVTGLDITDEPRFPHRGLQLDLARNFMPKEDVMRVIDLMGQYKLNKLHLHLANDEGWRIDIPDIPELTQVYTCICQ